MVKQLCFVPTMAVVLRNLCPMKELQSATKVPVCHFVPSTIRPRQSYDWTGAQDGSSLARQE